MTVIISSTIFALWAVSIFWLGNCFIAFFDDAEDPRDGNTAKAMVMLVLTLTIFFSGIGYMGGKLWHKMLDWRAEAQEIIQEVEPEENVWEEPLTKQYPKLYPVM